MIKPFALEVPRFLRKKFPKKLLQLKKQKTPLKGSGGSLARGLVAHDGNVTGLRGDRTWNDRAEIFRGFY